MQKWLKKSYKKHKRARLHGRIYCVKEEDKYYMQYRSEILLFSSESKRYIARITWGAHMPRRKPNTRSTSQHTLPRSLDIYISSLHVNQKWRNKGIGTRLIHDAVQYMQNGNYIQEIRQSLENPNICKIAEISLADASDRTGKKDNVYYHCGFRGKGDSLMYGTPEKIIESSDQKWRSKSKSNNG